MLALRSHFRNLKMLMSFAARATAVFIRLSPPAKLPKHKNQPRSEQIPKSHSTLSAYTMPPLRRLLVVSATLRQLKGTTTTTEKRSEKGQLHCRQVSHKRFNHAVRAVIGIPWSEASAVAETGRRNTSGLRPRAGRAPPR